MTRNYRTLRNAANNAAKIGNISAASEFAARAMECDYVEPADWRPHACYTHGIALPGADLTCTQTWGTKRAAQEAARAVGWRAGDVTKVYNRLHGERWAMVDGRFGLVSCTFYARMRAA